MNVSGMARSRGFVVGSAALVASLVGGIVFASLVGAEAPSYAPDPAIAAVEKQTLRQDTVKVEQVDETAGVTWTLVSYESSDGPCLDVHAEDDSGEWGKIGGCGTPDGPFRIGVGSIFLSGNTYTAAYGRPPVGAERMRLALSDGTTVTVSLVNGTYLHPLQHGNDVVRADALDRRGTVISSITR